MQPLCGICDPLGDHCSIFRTCWFNVPSNLTIFKPAPPKGWTSKDSGMENTDQLVPDHTVFWSARNLTHKKTSISPQCTWLTFADHCCWPFLSLSPAESAVHVIRQLLQLQYLRTNVLCLRWFVGCSCFPSFLSCGFTEASPPPAVCPPDTWCRSYSGTQANFVWG